MPKLWEDTVEAHREAVRSATIDTAAALVASHGLRGVTMSRIASEAGIGRATLYKYFADVEAILAAWHERHVSAHLAEFHGLAGRDAPISDRLKDVLTAYASRQHEQPSGELAWRLHQSEHVAHAKQHVQSFVAALLREGVEAGEIRDDVAVEEQASFCCHALSAAPEANSKAAVRRLVGLVLDSVSVRD